MSEDDTKNIWADRIADVVVRLVYFVIGAVITAWVLFAPNHIVRVRRIIGDSEEAWEWYIFSGCTAVVFIGLIFSIACHWIYNTYFKPRVI